MDSSSAYDEAMTSQAGPPVHHREVLYKIDPWSVAKVSAPLYLCAVATVVGLLVLLWGVLVGSGSVESFEKFVEDTGYSSFEFVPSQMFAGLERIAVILVVLGTAFNVVAVIIFNLLSAMLGGLQVDTVDKPTRRQRRGAAT